MANRSDITPELCRQLLRYEPETGKLFWRHHVWSCPQAEAKFAGKEALINVSEFGYKCGRIKGFLVQAHRVIWAIVEGEWPDFIDHINGDRADNRWCNLRSVGRTENSRNSAIPSDNTSGVVGVSWNTERQKWCAYINSAKRVSLGRFDNFEDAIKARKDAEKRFGYHANHGRHASRPLPT